VGGYERFEETIISRVEMILKKEEYDLTVMESHPEDRGDTFFGNIINHLRDY
jgi:hypothetical protein